MPVGRVQEALDIAMDHHRAGRLIEAEAAYLDILRAQPDEPESMQLAGLLYQQTGNTERSIRYLRRACELQPGAPGVMHNLAVALGEAQQFDEAIELFAQVLERTPDYALAWNNSGVILQRLGIVDQAIVHFERAIALDPVPDAHSSLLFLLNHLTDRTPQAIFEAHRGWAAQSAPPLPADDHPNQRAPDRPLRIGYISPDFQTHSVGFFIEPLIEAHDRDAFEVFCYANVQHPDAVTERIRAHADTWRDVWEMSDDDVAQLIRDDAVDILVDLAGHTKRTRLLVAARRPAPIQVTYLGYPNTTGLDAIDYRITDSWADPPGTTEAYHSEELVRLPGGFLCYRAPADAPQPERADGDAITFGSFNKAMKISDEALDVWARILKRLPDARLLLKSDTFSKPIGQRAFRQRLEALGVPQDRVELLAATESMQDHLDLYARIDVALDPYPYNGTTTTCEALWMGVPVVTLAGELHAGRTGCSLLAAVGLDEFVAESPEAYVDIAITLATDRPGIQELRRSLRERMRASPLCDADSTTRDLETAYRELWRRYCAQPAQAADGVAPTSRAVESVADQAAAEESAA